MEEPRNRYILLHDRVGNVIERNELVLGPSTKSTPVQVLKGELLEALTDQDEQPSDSTIIAFAVVDRKTWRLKCRADDVARLTSEDANLLLAISSSGLRYESYIDRNRLDFGRRILPGSQVLVEVKGISKKLHGTVWYKGDLPPLIGTMFGVELHKNPGLGMSDGTFRNKQYFCCPPDSGVFVELDKLTPLEDSDMKSPPESPKRDETAQGNFVSRLVPSFLKEKEGQRLPWKRTDYELKIDQRVVTFAGDVAVRGTVRYIGEEKQDGQVHTIAGLELDKKCGSGTGKLKGKQLFVAKRDYATFVDIETVIPEEDFDRNTGNSATSQNRDHGEPSGTSKFPNKMDQQEQKGLKEEQTSQKELTEMQQQELERARLHKQLREREMSMIRMEQQLRNCYGQLRQKDEQLREKDEQLRAKGEQLIEKDDELREKDEQAERKDEQLREKDAEQENLLEQLGEMEQQLREKEQHEEDLQGQLTEIKQQLRNVEEQSREREEERANLQQQLRQKDEQLREKDEQLRAKGEQLIEKDDDLREKDEQAERKDEQLREKDAEQENLLEQLGEMEQQLRENEQHEEDLQGQLTEIGQQLRNVEEQSREREEERANLQQQNVILERQLRDKEEEVNELEISLSTIQQTISEQNHQGTCDWVIVRNEIQISEKCLGRGGWGNVYEGMYCGCAIAVKQIHELILSPHNRRLFEREMNIASRCRHPCLLQFIGATNDEGSPLFVTELMETSLRGLLEQRQLSEAEIAVISMDVAKALNYLHQKKPEPIIHRDVSSANVLLWRQGDQWKGKVSDYGTANFMRQTMTVAPGNVVYSAPEALTSNQTIKVDVHSFGILLCEMCIRQLPDPSRRDEQVALVTNRALRGLVRRCLQTDPEMRPSMLEIIDSLSRQFKVQGWIKVDQKKKTQRESDIKGEESGRKFLFWSRKK